MDNEQVKSTADTMDVIDVTDVTDEKIDVPVMEGLPHETHSSSTAIQLEEETEEIIPSVGLKELKALKRARYSEIAEKYNKAYVLKKKKTGQIVEIRAASSCHACNIIGWKPRHTVLLEVFDVNQENEEEAS